MIITRTAIGAQYSKLAGSYGATTTYTINKTLVKIGMSNNIVVPLFKKMLESCSPSVTIHQKIISVSFYWWIIKIQ